MRVAHPTNDIASITEMYCKGLHFKVLGKFEDHDGFDGIMLGHPEAQYHLEFTHQRGYKAEINPGPEELLVFYIKNFQEWSEMCETAEAAGFISVRSHNPYWDENGKTFVDVDGYRIVLQNATHRVRNNNGE